ncbi:EAL domain-containing protein [Ciceribacter sp. L1K23]|uniref:sensor domain-containing protein n=1 Tax=Ciceribacter sp. L1K23 TaxID=2820276 RepID=UPI0032C2216D
MPVSSALPLSREATPQERSAYLEALPQAAAIVDVSGTVLAMNEPFHRLTGSARRPGTSSCFELVDIADQPRLQANLTAALTGSTPPPCDLILTAGDGRRSTVLALTSQVDDRRTRAAILLQFVDISERAEREAELARHESRWHQALTSAATGVWDHNFKTGEMYYSETWRHLRGLGPDDMPAATAEEWLQLLHPDDRDRVCHALERQNAGDPDYMAFEYRERHKAGHWVWIECRGACVEWDDKGQPTRIIGTDIDITARKNAEEMLRQMTARLELALETSKIGVFEADLDTMEVYWDERVMRIYGVEGPGRILPNGTWQSMLHPDDRDRAIGNSENAIRGGDEFYDQFRIFRKNDGEIRHLRSRATTIIDQNGRRRLLGVTWDVSDDITLHQQLDSAKTLAEARNRELEGARQRMEHIALHDHLTDLPNRRYLDAMLDQMEEHCRLTHKRLAVLHIDLDRFKQINDTLGHNAGDALLRHAASILRSEVAAGDFVARIGGDEFVVLVQFEGPEKRLGKLAERLIDHTRRPVTIEGHECRFGSSIGVAVSRGPVINARQLLLNADMALYHAKNRGRNRFEFFRDDDQTRAVSTKRLSDDILRGLEQDEFVPVYQFQFDARTLDVAGVETLARWQHPERGLLTPDLFLKAADDLNVVSDIDGRVLDKALADMRLWRQRGFSIPKLSVNVSSRRLHDPNLRKALAGIEIPPGALSFELLESIFLDDFDAQVKENLRLLRRLGISIEIDDFGTGHASIVSLLRLNPQALKIDRELIRKVPDSREQRQLVRAIIEIGHSLNVKVVAEGVETDAHVEVLRDLGCDVLQGFGLARPMPFDQTETFLKGQTWKRPATALSGNDTGR